MRINQYLARCGIASRRGADKLIEAGEVMIDGRVAVCGDTVDEGSTVTVSGDPIRLPDEYTVVAYYKPVGVTCSEKDSHADRLITDEISSDRRLTYAGRLDRDSEGLMIMTDDGSLIDAMMRGSAMHEKEYEVTLSSPVSDDQIRRLSEGVWLDELNVKTRPCIIKKQSEFCLVFILTQGLNRQIRRMCKAVGLEIVRLKRTRVMNIELKDLQAGASRKLSFEEKSRLYSECGLHI